MYEIIKRKYGSQIITEATAAVVIAFGVIVAEFFFVPTQRFLTCETVSSRNSLKN